HLEPIAALERVAARHGMSIHEYLAAGRTDDEILALAPDDRVIAEHCLIAEQSDVAFLGAADNRHALEQGIFTALARVAAIAAHDHQPPALEQLADQSDEESDQRAEDDDRDRSTERLRKRARQALVKKSAERSAEHAADSAIAPPRRRSRRRSNAESDRDSEHAPSQDSAMGPAQESEKKSPKKQPPPPPRRTDSSADHESARRLAQLAHAER